jgi:hypothetical protein
VTLKEQAKAGADPDTVYHVAPPGRTNIRWIKGQPYISGDLWYGSDPQRAWREYRDPATKLLWTWVDWDAPIQKCVPVGRE